MKRRFSLEGKLALMTTVLSGMAVVLSFVLFTFVDVSWLALLLTLTFIIPLSIYVVERYMTSINRVLQALTDGVASFRDSDFSISITQNRADELGDLVGLYNTVGEVLRDERQELFQRELLLDTIIQSTPIALILCNSRDQIVYSNTAARQLLHAGKKMEGSNLSDVLVTTPSELAKAISEKNDGLFTIDSSEDQETYHLSTRSFQLNTQSHQLYLIKQLTKELNRREVATWKKVIRVISHELNNSLAPIASLAHSGSLVAKNLESDKLGTVFSTIEERSGHLKKFIDGYARFAKLPQPRVDDVSWGDFVKNLQQTADFRLEGDLPGGLAKFDAGQMEQVMINLLKNAREAGSTPDDIVLRVSEVPNGIQMLLEDGGSGMSDPVLSSALLPFYSTKQTGTGIGLPLCREIVEAHGGRLNLKNRTKGGLCIDIFLPQ